MNIKRILLTGDDGYNAIGTRLLIHFLKNDFELAVAGTMTQQSGVGGYISLKEGGTWAEGELDGVPAVWVSGSPVDAMEVAQGYFPRAFDAVVSGINWGANISGSLITSGTVAAALRSLTLQLAPRAMAISWHMGGATWFKVHNGDEELADYLDHPGETAYRLITMAIKNNWWNVPFLNINMPVKKSRTARFTKFLPDITQFYSYPLNLDRTTKRFSFPKNMKKKPDAKMEYDSNTVLAGHSSITPCARDLLDERSYQHLKNKEITLT